MNKRLIYLKIFGNSMLEAYFADTLLQCYYDGTPKETDRPATGSAAWTEQRIMKMLLDSHFLEPFDKGFVITSAGRMHLDKGGYTGHYVAAKTQRLALWLGILATAVSIVAFIRTL
jgi:hypothetical protein